MWRRKRRWRRDKEEVMSLLEWGNIVCRGCRRKGGYSNIIVRRSRSKRRRKRRRRRRRRRRKRAWVSICMCRGSLGLSHTSRFCHSDAYYRTQANPLNRTSLHALQHTPATLTKHTHTHTDTLTHTHTHTCTYNTSMQHIHSQEHAKCYPVLCCVWAKCLASVALTEALQKGNAILSPTTWPAYS